MATSPASTRERADNLEIADAARMREPSTFSS
jgi:hypothetical protein